MGYNQDDVRDVAEDFRTLAEANREKDNIEAASVQEDAANHVEEELADERDRETLVEELAALEHRQWRHWAENIAKTEDISDERRERWESQFVPYEELPEDVKVSDRDWARQVLEVLEGEGA